MLVYYFSVGGETEDDGIFYQPLVSACESRIYLFIYLFICQSALQRVRQRRDLKHTVHQEPQLCSQRSWRHSSKAKEETGVDVFNPEIFRN